MSSDLPEELQTAREVLLAEDVPPGAKLRVRQRIASQIDPARQLRELPGRSLRQRWGWPVLVGVLVSGAAGAAQSSKVQHWLATCAEAVSGGAAWAIRPSEPAPVTTTSGVRKPGGAPAARKQRLPAAAPEVPSAPSTTPSMDDAAPTPTPQRRGQTSSSASSHAERDPLAQQVAEFKQATQVRDAGLMVSRLRAFKQRWPASPLQHEADLQIVAALRRVGDDDAARQAAQRFLNDYPDSGRAAEVRALFEADE